MDQGAADSTSELPKITVAVATLLGAYFCTLFDINFVPLNSEI
jgi:hypothetical protein